MATSAARQAVNPTMPRPPDYGLLFSAATPPESDDIRSGVGYSPVNITTGAAVDACAFTAKPTHSRGAKIEADPIGLVAGDRCSAFGWTAEQYEERARASLLAQESFLIEREFWTGTIVTAAALENRFLADGGATLIGGAASPLVEVIACLEEAVASAARGQTAMLHVPVRAVEHLPQTVERDTAGRLRTRLGSIIVPGSGYPTTGDGGAAAGANAVNVYATTIVTVRRTPAVLFPDSLAAAMDRKINSIEFQSERTWVATWDTPAHFRALATVPDC